MFTGIVEEIGTINNVKIGAHSAVLTIYAEKVLADLEIGDSVAVNGVCLTVTWMGAGQFSADVMHETMKRSTLSNFKIGSRVNLERAMPANGRFGGHIVSGHVDGIGKIESVARDDIAVLYTVQAHPSVLRYIVEKGSIAIDGISLTVADVSSNNFCVSVIPHTVQMTSLSERQKGDEVNLETDMIGKYVEKFVCDDIRPTTQNVITEEFLTRYGY